MSIAHRTVSAPDRTRSSFSTAGFSARPTDRATSPALDGEAFTWASPTTVVRCAGRGGRLSLDEVADDILPSPPTNVDTFSIIGPSMGGQLPRPGKAPIGDLLVGITP